MLSLEIVAGGTKKGTKVRHPIQRQKFIFVLVGDELAPTHVSYPCKKEK